MLVGEYRDKTHIKSYVKRALRMSDHQRRAYDRLAPLHCIPLSDSPIDPAGLFTNRARTIVEIGFGMGAATAELAARRPDWNFLGIEVYKPGVGKLLSLVEEHDLSNVRIIHDDAILAMERMIAPNTIDGLHLFFPDPWPKKRHHKRRIIRSGLTSMFAERIRPGGYLYFVTDWEEYAHRALEILTNTPELVNEYESFADPVPWRPRTAFEAKAARAGRPVRELLFRRHGS